MSDHEDSEERYTVSTYTETHTTFDPDGTVHVVDVYPDYAYEYEDAAGALIGVGISAEELAEAISGIKKTFEDMGDAYSRLIAVGDVGFEVAVIRHPLLLYYPSKYAPQFISSKGVALILVLVMLAIIGLLLK